MKKFAVYGGCVSRDVFNYLDNDVYNPALTIGQNPISTMFEPAVKIPLEDYEVGANFEKRMLYYDANKLAYEKIKESNTEYFIFDIICERITMMKYELDGVVSTVEKSWVFVDNFLKMKKNEKYKTLKKIEDMEVLDLDDSYEEKIDRFCEMIMKKYPPEKIIFLEVRLVDEYIDKDGMFKCFNFGNGYKLVSQYNHSSYANKVLDRVEKRIKQRMPGIHYIPMPKAVLASSKHHFGLHPLHFEDAYYEYVASALKMIVDLKKPELTQKVLEHLCTLQSESNQNNKKKLLEKQIIIEYFPEMNCDWKILNTDIWKMFGYEENLILCPNGRKYGRIFLKLDEEPVKQQTYIYDIKWKVVSTKKIRLMLTSEDTAESAVTLMSEREATGIWQRIQGEFVCNTEGLRYLMLSSTDFNGQGAMLSFDWIRIYKK